MITILLLLGVLSVSAIGILIFQASHAPAGHEDADGFHYAPCSVPQRTLRGDYENEPDHSAAAHVATQHIPAM